MKEQVDERFNALLLEGQTLVSNLRRDSDGSYSYYIDAEHISDYQSWIASSSNLIRLVSPQDSYFVEECQRLVTEENLAHGIPAHIIQKLYGLLSSTFEEWNYGLLKRIEYMIAGETFDDFLDQAASYHKGNKAMESSVLASAVLEDTVKKIADLNDVDTSDKTLEPIIDELVKKQIFTPVKAKRIKGYVGVRNHALHAEWDQVDIKDVGAMINGIRELIEKFL